MAETHDALAGWTGRELFDARGDKIGTVSGAGYARPRFGTTWLLVETASGTQVLAPVSQVKEAGDRLVMPYPRSYVEAAPESREGRRLSRVDERRLCLHYGFEDELPGSGCRQGCGLCGSRRRAGTAASAAA